MSHMHVYAHVLRARLKVCHGKLSAFRTTNVIGFGRMLEMHKGMQQRLVKRRLTF